MFKHAETFIKCTEIDVTYIISLSVPDAKFHEATQDCLGQLIVHQGSPVDKVYLDFQKAFFKVQKTTRCSRCWEILDMKNAQHN